MKNHSRVEKYTPIVAYCDHFGYIETGIYKPHYVKHADGGKSSFPTFAVGYSEAIEELHQWIVDNPWAIEDYPKAKFTLSKITGFRNKYGEPTTRNLYTITANNAKQLLFTNFNNVLELYKLRNK